MLPCDGSRFDVTNGKVLAGPSPLALGTYEAREVGGKIAVRV